MVCPFLNKCTLQINETYYKSYCDLLGVGCPMCNYLCSSKSEQVKLSPTVWYTEKVETEKTVTESETEPVPEIITEPVKE